MTQAASWAIKSLEVYQEKNEPPENAAIATAWWRITNIVVLLSLIVIIGIGAMFLFCERNERPSLEILLPTATPTKSTELKVYITGAVAYPGVYSLRQGERVEDALAAAGGPTKDADLTRINLAAKVKDEQHVHIPKPGESLPQESSDEHQKININTAPAELLETLPGIGEVMAQVIINYRNEHGDFERIEDLVEVAGIGHSTYENLKDLITVD